MRSILMLSSLAISVAVSASASDSVQTEDAKRSAATAVSSAVAPASKEVAIEVVTVVGPKRTQTVIKKQSDGTATFEMTGAETGPIVRTLSAKDFEFFVKKMKELPVVEKLPAGCQRFQLEVTTQGLGEKFAKRQGCIGQKTNTSAKFEDFTQVLEAATL